jgi:hypothetical protein
MTCQHTKTEPVMLNDPDGTVVAELCTECLDALPVGWNCPACEFEEIRVADQYEPIGRVLVGPCQEHS